MKRVVRIDHDATAKLLAEALPLLTPLAQEFAGSVQVYVTVCRRGRADRRNRVVRVPHWVFCESVNFNGKGYIAGGLPFAAYYLAHELAHVKADSDGHGASFMAAFKSLCPTELQWYETIYKPRLAAAAGISQRTD